MTSFNPHHNVLNEVGIILTLLQPRKLGGGVGSKSLCNFPKVTESEQGSEDCQHTHSERPPGPALYQVKGRRSGWHRCLPKGRAGGFILRNALPCVSPSRVVPALSVRLLRGNGPASVTEGSTQGSPRCSKISKSPCCLTDNYVCRK